MDLKILILKLKVKVRTFLSLYIDANEYAESMRDKFYFLGKNVKLYSPQLGTEPYLISLHDNVVCAHNVTFLNHDVSCKNIARFLGIDEDKLSKLGSIELKENSFIGAHSIIMPGVSIGRNSIVAAGSVVTHSIPDNEVWGGVPARQISTTQRYAEKIMTINRNYPWVDKLTGNKLNLPKSEILKIRQDYLFRQIVQ